jgi:hopanoid-associated phosphorylase
VTSSPVLAVTGLAKEARLASGPGVVAIGAGGDPQRLRRLLDARDPAGCRAVVSIGIAGGLDPSLQPGDVVVASGVLVDGHRYVGDARIAEALRRRLSDLGAGPKPALRVIAADLAGVDAAVLTVDGKAALHARTGAAAVDMESHVAAEFAARYGLPFAAIRVVCDPADRALPSFVAHALKPNGEPDILAVLGALARRHVTVAELLRLARDSSIAFKALARCRSCLGDGLGVPP